MMTLEYVTRRAAVMTARLKRLNNYVEYMHNTYDSMSPGPARRAVLDRATRAVDVSETVSNAMLFYVRQRSRLQS